MKRLLASALILISTSAFASTKPCLKQAKQVVYKNIDQMTEDADCEVKLRKVHQSTTEVTYSADISCVTMGGFFDLSDLVVMKYEKLASGKYSCTVQ